MVGVGDLDGGWREMEMLRSSRILLKSGHATPETRTSEMPAGELRQITENVREGSRKKERASSTGKQDVPGSRGGSFFPPTLKSYISPPLTAAGFLVASSPQQTASVPEDSHDYQSEKLHDDCTGELLSPGKMARYSSNLKIAAEKQSGLIMTQQLMNTGAQGFPVK